MSICDCRTTFKEVGNISNDFFLNIIEGNFKIYFDWAFLKIGAWFDVNRPDETIFGGNSHYKLLSFKDPGYDDGQIWQGVRKDWVWESGINFNSTSNPIVISGIYINNSFVAKSSNSFTIDYPNGRVILNNAVNTNSNITINYSYRFVQTYRSVDAPWFNTLQYSSLQTDNKDISQADSGDWIIASNHRIQLPAIVIEAAPRSRSLPFELGSNSLILEQDIVFHVLAENKSDRNKLLDILRLQQDSVIWLYDTNKIAQDDNFPLNYNGDLKNNPLMYPNIIDQYQWRKCWIKNVQLFEIDSIHPNMHRGMIRATLEIISG